MPIQADEQLKLNKAVKRWVDLRSCQGQRLRWFVACVDAVLLGGYIFRGSLELLSPSGRPTGKPDAANAVLRRWTIARLPRGGEMDFCPVFANVNFIGGYVKLSQLAAADPGILRDQLFFEQYDLRFHPVLLLGNPQISPEEKRRRMQIVERTEQALYRIMLERAAAAKAGLTFPVAAQPGALNAGDLRYLSAKQLELYREFFSDGQGGIDFAGVQRAFERFDNGELQGNAYPGALQPDSASDFLYAEFALQAIYNDIEPQVWSELLKSFVKTQEIYVDVYRPPGVKQPDLDDYAFTHFRSERQVDQPHKERQRQRYDRMSLGELEAAYRRNLARAQSPAAGGGEEAVIPQESRQNEPFSLQ
ncbi:hypothetical protein B5M42_014880 [Paenibacillus athensensis]|uniref:Uncharacterized protein n=1 Tax=Paenibacillus athensensis TaxID=1967502 RepID=A0A4Y8QA20_9BACL|nr:hypothetical protein [Paenibacillus athensensis]MCD1260097.1 hypothetical protein [Paenibacillus athensensis]